MILRRLASAIRHQNWSQIIIEILIVVIGIFLGLQLQAAYEERQERAQEQAYLERMHAELVNVEDAFEDYRGQYVMYTNRFSELLEAISISVNDIELDENHCRTIANSHIYIETAISLPTMTELISSGRLSTVSDQGLREAIANYLIEDDRGDQVLTGFYSDRLELSSKYRELIAYDFGGDYNSFQGTVDFTCDFQAMRNSRPFKNDLLMNARRMRAFNSGEINEVEMIFSIHDQVDLILGITHEK